MGDRLTAGKPLQYFTKPPRQTQPPPILSGTGKEYRPKCGHALRLGRKGTVWFIPLVDKRVHGRQVKNCVIPRQHVTRAIPERFY